MNRALLGYVDSIIDNYKGQRVFSIEFDGQMYYVKQDIGNHRSSWIKPAPRASFDYEFYKINYVNTQVPLAPSIEGFREHYFITADGGQNLTYYSHLPKQHPQDHSLPDTVRHIFYAFGKSLGMLHDHGIGHGRPAMRDIVYDPDKDQITLLDWENDRRWPGLTAQGWDLILFTHSYLRENDLPVDYLYAMMSGYATANTSTDTLLHVKAVLRRYEYIFRICDWLTPFHFVDTEAAVKANRFLLGLKVT